MKINVYLPDEIGEKAKETGLNLSGLLRSAVEDELMKLEAQAKLLDESKEIKLTDLIDDEGRFYTGRFNGSQITYGRKFQVYISENDALETRIMVHDVSEQKIYYLDGAADLEAYLDQDEYIEAMHALGEAPVVNI